MIAAGARDKLVTIQALTDTTDAGGFPVETWTDLTPPEWMAKQDEQDRDQSAERFVSNQWSERSYVDWFTHFRADLDPEVVNVPKARRLVYRGRVYEILQAARLLGEDGYGIKLITREDLA